MLRPARDHVNSSSLDRARRVLHTLDMTLPDLGPERPGEATETRQMVERGRTESGAEISGKAFLIALLVIAAGIVGVALLLR